MGLELFNSMTGKKEALSKHKSQIADLASVEKRIIEWSSKLCKRFGCRYAEGL